MPIVAGVTCPAVAGVTVDTAVGVARLYRAVADTHTARRYVMLDVARYPGGEAICQYYEQISIHTYISYNNHRWWSEKKARGAGSTG